MCRSMLYGLFPLSYIIYIHLKVKNYITSVFASVVQSLMTFMTEKTVICLNPSPAELGYALPLQTV